MNRRLAAIVAELQTADDLRRRLDDARELTALALDDDDRAALADVAAEADTLGPAVTETSVRLHLDGAVDSRAAVLRITAGGRTVTADDGFAGDGSTKDEFYAERLLDMYVRWSARHSAADPRPYQVRGLDTAKRDYVHAVVITAPYAYGKLRDEAGRHIFTWPWPDTNGRVRTSELTVEVVPLAEEDDPGAPTDADVRCDTYRSAGPSCSGPRYRSTARLVHLPTGMAVGYRRDRAHAMLVLRSLITSAPAPVAEVRHYDLRGAGSVMDLRTGRRCADLLTVSGDDLDEFIADRLLPSERSS